MGKRTQTRFSARMIQGARASEMPGFVAPQLAASRSRAPSGDQWLHEIKYDGYRVQLRLQDGAVSLLTRNGHDWTDRFGGVPQAARALQAKTALIDGEMVVLDERGVSSFARLKAALGDRAAKWRRE
jgi:bifunctional non-homologous end joining protein LigD